MIVKRVVMRGGEYKCKIVKIHLKLRDQQLKAMMYIYRYRYKYINIDNIDIYKPHGNHKPKICNIYNTKKRRGSRYNTKDSHQITRKDNKRRRKE